MFFPIESVTVSFKTSLFLYKVKLLAKRYVSAICASACDVTKRDKLFNMVQKMQTYDENEYRKRSLDFPPLRSR